MAKRAAGGSFQDRPLALLPRGAVVVSVGRGALIVETALVEALRSGHVGAAYPDMFESEPLPTESPLWDMENVLISTHSASTSDRENARIAELSCDKLRRWKAGNSLRNVFDADRQY